MKSFNLWGKDARLHHLGIAVRTLPKVKIGPFDDENQRVRVGFVVNSGVLYEFVQPLNSNSPISRIVDSNVGLYHACFEVPSMSIALETAKSNECTCIHEPAPAAAFGGRMIAWLYHRAFGLTEILENPGGGSAFDPLNHKSS